MALKISNLFQAKLSAQEQLHFSEQLLALIYAGLPLLHAIQLLTQSANSSWLGWLHELHHQLKEGDSFSECLIRLDGKFSMEFVNLIKVSERSGDLNLALKTISQQLTDQIELRRKIQQALSYPMITLASSILLVIVMMIWVIPVFKDVFENFHAELPAPTQALMRLSGVIANWFSELCITFLILSVCFFILWLRSTRLQKLCDRLSLRIPIIGNLFRLAVLTHWCRTLAHLLASGLPLPEALRITAQSSNHWVSHDFSAEVFKHLTRGWPLGEALSKADPSHTLCDLETLQLLRIGSESGSLDAMLGKRAHSLGAQLSSQLNALSQNLEPLMIILVGAIIGSLVIILYLPIFNLGQIV